jgi:hypothetical protein
MAAILDLVREYVDTATSPAIQPAVVRECVQLLPRLHRVFPPLPLLTEWNLDTARLLLSLLKFHNVMLRHCRVSHQFVPVFY